MTTFSSKELKRVLDFLDDGQWRYADEIQAYTKIPSVKLRCMANQTGELISGGLGYKLTIWATQAEFDLSIKHLEGRIRGIENHIESLKNFWSCLE